MHRWLIVSMFVIFHLQVYASGYPPAEDSSTRKLPSLPDKYYSQVKRKSQQFEQRVNRRADKALSRLLRREKKMQARLAKIDSAAAKHIFPRSIDSLNSLKDRLCKKAGNYQLPLNNNYNGYLDTLQGSLKFLQASKDILGPSKDKISSTAKSVQALQGKLQQAEQIKAYIREHKQQLNEQLASYTGFTRDLRKMSEEAYYYSQQLNEYKSLLRDRKKAEAKALETLKKLPAYNDFLQRNSQLAGLFNLSSSSGNITQGGMEGLQTRAQLAQLVQQRLGSGPDVRSAMSQQIEQARTRLEELKNKFPGAGSDADMPDFKPNEMKTKGLLQRLEFGGNMQFQRANGWYPTTSDLAGQVAYKFHKNGSAGLGAAYKLGWGNSINNIALSSRGVGIRSFVDWKLKGTFFVNGGFEQNYNTDFTRIEELKNWSGWQGSALLGISKKYKISGKMKGNIMLLYDFLSTRQVPATDALKLRMGYNF